MITKEILKQEIDNISPEYLTILYRIIKSFESPDESSLSGVEGERGTGEEEEWSEFIDKFAGSLADTPIHRGGPGMLESREDLAV